MALLTRQQILDAKDLPTQEVKVPEWGGEVLVRGLESSERSVFEAEAHDEGGMDLKTVRERFCQKSIVDKEGNLVFSLEDVELLGKKSALGLSRVFKVAQKLSGLGEDAVKELTADLTKARS